MVSILRKGIQQKDVNKLPQYKHSQYRFHTKFTQHFDTESRQVHACSGFVSCKHRWIYPHMISFTLIELLIIIAILAILAAMLLPALNLGRQKALEVNCIGRLRSIGQAEAMYIDDYNDMMTPVVSSLVEGEKESEERRNCQYWSGEKPDIGFGILVRQNYLPSVVKWPSSQYYDENRPKILHCQVGEPNSWKQGGFKVDYMQLRDTGSNEAPRRYPSFNKPFSKLSREVIATCSASGTVLDDNKHLNGGVFLLSDISVVKTSANIYRKPGGAHTRNTIMDAFDRIAMKK